MSCYFDQARVAQSVHRLRYGLDNRGSIPGGGNFGTFFLSHRVKTESGDHPGSYPMGAGSSFHGDKAAGA
jgi:hypothetical protein